MSGTLRKAAGPRSGRRFLRRQGLPLLGPAAFLKVPDNGRPYDRAQDLHGRPGIAYAFQDPGEHLPHFPIVDFYAYRYTTHNPLSVMPLRGVIRYPLSVVRKKTVNGER